MNITERDQLVKRAYNPSKNGPVKNTLLQTDGLERLWGKIKDRFGLSDEVMNKLMAFYDILAAESQKHNLVGYKTFPEVLSNLFTDSLEVTKYFDFSNVNSIADIGTGAGFPSLVLKIVMPEKEFHLIEVSKKKIEFLTKVIDALKLDKITVVEMDWRTFCHKNQTKIDLFLSKATFREKELCRLFKSYSLCQDARLVYWASSQWECELECQKYLQQSLEYKINNKARRYVVFQKPNLSA